jgi:hypothetical protein
MIFVLGSVPPSVQEIGTNGSTRSASTIGCRPPSETNAINEGNRAIDSQIAPTDIQSVIIKELRLDVSWLLSNSRQSRQAVYKVLVPIIRCFKIHLPRTASFIVTLRNTL